MSCTLRVILLLGLLGVTCTADAQGVRTALDPAFKKRRDRLKGGAKGYVKLAKWCRKEKLFGEEREALALALRADPENAAAKKQLGRIASQEQLHSNYKTPWRRDSAVLFVETNTSEALLHSYCDTVSAFYKRFAKIFNVREGPVKKWGKKIGVKIFRSKEDFQRYRQEASGVRSESAVGYYSLANKELVLFHDPSDPAETLDTLFHEGTHLFSHLALGDKIRNLPHWVGEGLAEYFGPSQYDRESEDLIHGRPSYGRLSEARLSVQTRKPSLKADLLAVTDYDAFDSAHYALAWGLVHMLITKTKKKGKKPIYRSGFVKYFELVSRGRGAVSSFEKVIGPLDVLEAEWLEYLETFPVPLFEAGVAMFTKGENRKAIALLTQHCAAEPDDPRGHYFLAEAHYGADDLKAAIAEYRKVIALEPNHAEAHAGLGFSLCYDGDPKAALPHAKKAADLSPSGYTLTGLATVALFLRDKATATRAIAEAIKFRGENPYLLALKQKIDAL